MVKEVINKLIRPFIPGTYQNLLRKKEYILTNYSHKQRLKDVIISMTTYGPRVHFFEYSILSLLGGSVLPEKILVYVPKGFKSLISNHGSILEKVYESGLVVLIEMDEDYYSHSKYYYCFKDFGVTKNIVLADDDVVYYKEWLAHLYNTALDNPNYQVFAYKAVEVTFKDRVIEPYDNWIHYNKNSIIKTSHLYTEAVGGVWYSKGMFTKEVLDKDNFLALAERADDVWLWYCVWINGGKVMYVPTLNNKKLQYIIPNSQEVALWKENTFGKRNDGYVLACHQFFKEKYNKDIIDDLIK